MARLIVIFLIALLPLRGWSATGMAIQMALMESAAVASSAESNTSAMPADCPMMQMASSAVGDPSHSSDKSMDVKGHQGCQTCQLCMGMAVLDSLSAKFTEPAPFGPTLARADRFSSAELFEDSKPPIS